MVVLPLTTGTCPVLPQFRGGRRKRYATMRRYAGGHVIGRLPSAAELDEMRLPHLQLAALLVSLMISVTGGILFLIQHQARCEALPWFNANRLPNADLAAASAGNGLPDGWGRLAGGVELRGPAVDGEGFDLDGDGRALQLIGIANAALTPPTAVEPGTDYCLTLQALTDSPQRSPTRLRLVFEWLDSTGTTIGSAATPWQSVVLWSADAPPSGWSPISGSAVAPAAAAQLRVRIEPTSDDRIYLDHFFLARGGSEVLQATAGTDAVPFRVARWPAGKQAALAFSFDWESAMGGLIHSRSVDDPNSDQDPLLRALRMREGITTTLAVFAPHEIRATYFANGYNLLFGNREQRTFLNDPIFSWANRANGWLSDRWQTTRWFVDDPYLDVAAAPAWYFADLLAPLRAADQEIASHSFSHLHVGLADLTQWRDDLATWNRIAAEQGLGPATSLAFPWSSSAGLSDAGWDALEQAGIRAVTRLSDYGPYNLFPTDQNGLVISPFCRWVPGRESRVLACPDAYLTPSREAIVLRQIDAVLAAGGMIDVWAHTEEVTTPEQIAAWQRVTAAAAAEPRLWIAPFGEISAWQSARDRLLIEPAAAGAGGGDVWRLTNRGDVTLRGLVLQLPVGISDAAVDGTPAGIETSGGENTLTLDLAVGQTIEVTLWQNR